MTSSFGGAKVAGAYASGAGAYARVGVESQVISANPHQLITLLFDGAITAIRAARLHMQNGNAAEKGKAISKALDIVNQGLMTALDRDKGGEIADNLGLLYDYIVRQLLQANLHNDLDKLDEAERLLTDLGSAWREIGNSNQGGANDR